MQVDGWQWDATVVCEVVVRNVMLKCSTEASSQKAVLFSVFETVWKTASGVTSPFTVTFCYSMSKSNDSTPEIQCVLLSYMQSSRFIS